MIRPGRNAKNLEHDASSGASHTEQPDRAPGRVSDGPFDLSKFWREHDSTLAQHEKLGDASLSHDLYRGMPKWFNAYYAYFQRRALHHLLRKCDIQPGMRALDLGCGTGRWSGLLSAMGLQTYGLDVGERVLQYAAHKWPRARFIAGELPFLCFGKESFDLVVSVTVLQHLPHERQRDAIRAIHQVLKPGGDVIVCETTDVHDPSPHVFGNHLDCWLEMFSDTGFRLVEQTGCEYMPYIRLFHLLGHFLSQAPNSSLVADVSHTAQLLRTSALLSLTVRLVITASYPLECFATGILPHQWARLACFLLRKP